MGSRPSVVMRTPAAVCAKASTGRMTTRPLNPASAKPIGSPTTARMGCRSSRRPVVVRARARSRAIEPRTKITRKTAAGTTPRVARAIVTIRTAASARPAYGTNAATRATTASGPANGTPSTNMAMPARRAVATAITEVPRMYPPTWSSARRPPLMRASRRHPSVKASPQSQALSPSMSRKKVRKPPRMATVTLFAAAATKSLRPPRTRPRITSEIRCRIPVRSAETPSVVSWARAASIPASNAETKALNAGTTARMTAATTAPSTRSAPRLTTPAALARPEPRARRSLTNGASVAARISARTIEATTVESCPAIANRTTTRASVTRTRQPIAARRTSQPGTSGLSAGTAAPPSSITLGMPHRHSWSSSPLLLRVAAAGSPACVQSSRATVPRREGRVVIRRG